MSSDGMEKAQEGQPRDGNCWAGALTAALDTRDQGQEKSCLNPQPLLKSRTCNQENTDFWLGPNIKWIGRKTSTERWFCSSKPSKVHKLILGANVTEMLWSAYSQKPSGMQSCTGHQHWPWVPKAELSTRAPQWKGPQAPQDHNQTMLLLHPPAPKEPCVPTRTLIITGTWAMLLKPVHSA